jgi:hypothetical protein
MASAIVKPPTAGGQGGLGRLTLNHKLVNGGEPAYSGLTDHAGVLALPYNEINLGSRR